MPASPELPKVVVSGHSFGTLDPERAVLEGVARLVETQPRTTEELVAATRDAVAILNQTSVFTADVVDRLERCRVIVSYGVGFDKIDVAAATRRGILVCNVPDYGTEEVATHALALLLAFERRIPFRMDRLAKGHWDAPEPGSTHRLRGRTLGIVGIGRIGTRVAALARPFGLSVLAHDPYVADDEVGRRGAQACGFTELLERSDYVTLHCPLTEGTRGLVDAAALARMRPGSVLINTARGRVVHEAALVAALRAGRLRGAALDVFENEPAGGDNPLLALPNVIATPHTAWFSDEAELALKRGAADEARRAILGEPPRSPVNA